jgi:hypothetical protein
MWNVARVGGKKRKEDEESPARVSLTLTKGFVKYFLNSSSSKPSDGIILLILFQSFQRTVKRQTK